MTLTTDHEMATAPAESAAFIAPGKPGSIVELKTRYDNFIGGNGWRRSKGPYMVNLRP